MRCAAWLATFGNSLTDANREHIYATTSEVRRDGADRRPPRCAEPQRLPPPVIAQVAGQVVVGNRRIQSATPDLLQPLLAKAVSSTIRGLASEVRVGLRNGLDAESVVSCDNITTVRKDAVGATIGMLLDDQEADLARAISDAVDLV